MGFINVLPLYVILSEENREAICEVELLRVERKRTSKSARHFAEAGYGSKFWWLTSGKLHLL